MKKLRYLMGIKVKNTRTESEEIIAMRNRIDNDLAFITKAEGEIKRYSEAIARAKKRILRLNYEINR